MTFQFLWCSPELFTLMRIWQRRHSGSFAVSDETSTCHQTVSHLNCLCHYMSLTNNGLRLNNCLSSKNDSKGEARRLKINPQLTTQLSIVIALCRQHQFKSN